MSDEKPDTIGKRPDYVAYNVREGKEGSAYWNRVGAAWNHQDGQGMELTLDSIPVDGRITLREQRDEQMQRYEDERTERGQSDGKAREPAPRARTR